MPMKRQRQRHHAAQLLPDPPEGSQASTVRLVARHSSEHTLAVGLRRPWFTDLYYQTLTVSWPRFLLIGSATYIAGNILFALLYLLQAGAITNARPGSFADAFFFSVQTMATIGYGQMAPATLYANLLVTLETMFALI